MAIITPAEGTDFVFLDYVGALGLLVTDSAVFEPTTTRFTARSLLADGTAVDYEVEGTDFLYQNDGQGGLVLISGVIETVDIFFDGPLAGTVTSIGLAAGDVVAARNAAVDGTAPTAIEELIFSQNFEYIGSLGSGAAELAPQNTAIGPNGFLFNPSGDDVFDLGDGAADFFAGDGDDLLLSGSSNDRLSGGNGDDDFVPGRGDDVVLGGEGADLLALEGLVGGGYDLFIARDAAIGEIVFGLDRITGSVDAAIEVELFEDLAGGESADPVQTIDIDQLRVFDGLAYLASHADLAAAFGANALSGIGHYVDFGFIEGRGVTFDGSQYLANYADLAAAFGADTGAAAAHFIASGLGEGRLAEDPLDYIASYSDLIGAFGGIGDLRGIGLAHYQGAGAAEGRRAGIEFDPVQYLANYADLRAAFGDPFDANGEENAAAGDIAAEHFIRAGFGEGRLWEDPLTYIASYADLIGAFGGAGGNDVASLGLAHFQLAGSAEGRRAGIDFDVDTYLANYADLRAIFADGTGGYDETAATLHFIQTGFNEGRTDEQLFG